MPNKTFSDQELPLVLQDTFRAYKAACPDLDGSTNFMPELWAKIESRRRVNHSFGRLTGFFVTASAALCLVFSVALFQHGQTTPTTTTWQSSYVDVLADDVADDVEVGYRSDLI